MADTNAQPYYNDQPIEQPEHDCFGFSPFAKALAKSIRHMSAPQGTVISIHGPWGSGKSSAVNLCKHYLKADKNQAPITIIDFNCWWFRGEEALALAFFHALSADLGPTLGNKAKQLLPKIGARLLRTGAVVGKFVEWVGPPVVGGMAEKTMDWIADGIGQDKSETVETLYKNLVTELKTKQQRFLIVIDDIDRLAPDEALLIFRLVKSVGRLPNVIYLLAYDRALAEKIVSEQYPSEGPHYLDKIVQAAFELPNPAALDMQQYLQKLLSPIYATSTPADSNRFNEMVARWIAPAMRTPRDITRFTNVLSVSWPAVADEVDRADFLALEMLRLRHPNIYQTIRQNQQDLCGIQSQKDKNSFNELFFGKTPPPPESAPMRRLLIKLFPALASAWSNILYEASDAQQWARERRICSHDHFDSYFRFTISENVLSSQALNDFLAKADDLDYVKTTLIDASKCQRRSGGTQAAVWLDELTAHAGRVAPDKIEPLLTALFAIADEIDVAADGQIKPISNHMRLHWLIRNLMLEAPRPHPISLTERSAILASACDQAALGWLAGFTRAAWADYHPAPGAGRKPIEQCLVDKERLESLRQLLGEKLTAAAKNGSLLTHPDLRFIIDNWLHLTPYDPNSSVQAELKDWLATVLSTDDGVKQLARVFTSYSTVEELYSAAPVRRVIQVDIPEWATNWLDMTAFRTRVQTLAEQCQDADLLPFLNAWRATDQATTHSALAPQPGGLDELSR